MIGARAIHEPPAATIVTRLRRRGGVFLSVFGVVAVGCWLAIESLTPRYAASASVIVQGNSSLLDERRPDGPLTIGDPADMESQLRVLASSGLLVRLLGDPAVQGFLAAECVAAKAPSPLLARIRPPDPSDRAAWDADCAALASSRTAALEWINDRLTVGVAGRSRILSIDYVSASPEAAAGIANAVVENYLRHETQQKVGSRSEAIAWLGTEIGTLANELRKSERAIQEYRQAHDLLSGQSGPLGNEELSALTRLLAEAKRDRAEALAKAGRMEIMVREGRIDALPDVVASQNVGRLKEQQLAAERRIGELAEKLGPQHPDLRAVRSERVQIIDRIAQEIRGIAASLRAQAESAAVREASLTQDITALKARLATQNNADAALQGLLRDAAVKRELYMELLRRKKELETEIRILVPDAQLVSRAEIPSKVWFPKKLPFLATGLAFAGVLAGAAALIRDAMERRVRSAADVAQPSAILAHVPRFGRFFPPARASLAKESGGLPPAVREAMRSLYAQLHLKGLGSQVRTLLVTSSEAGEGKTSLCMALASFAASTGQRVLAIECDLRRPGLAALIAGERSRGVGDYLRGAADFAELARPASVAGLDVIGAGGMVEESTELLVNGRMERLLEEARERYDLVIVDSPPCLPVMDALILSRWVDGVLFCARWGRSSPEVVQAGLQSVKDAGGVLVGVVLSMVKSRQYHLYNRLPMSGRSYPASSGPLAGPADTRAA